MPDGGFLVKFDGKEIARCYAFAVDYDEWQYTVNKKEKKDLPEELEKISLEVE